MSRLWLRAVRAALDRTFGPVPDGLDDFTLLFQETILTILPTALLLLLTPLYLLYYNHKPVVSSEIPLLWAKLVISAVVFVLHLVAAVFDIIPHDSTDTAAAAAILSCAAALAIALLLYFEHRRAVQSSALISLYLSITVLFDIAKTRSCFLRDGARLAGSLFAAITASQLALLLLEEVPKKYRDAAGNPGKETTNGFWARTFFVWMNSTLLLGFRKTLSVDRLPRLDPAFTARVLAGPFEKRWIKSKISSLRLMKATIWSLPGSFFAVVPARLLHIAFSFTQPFLIQRTLQYIDDEEDDEDFRNGLIGATALTYLGVAFCRVWYTHLNNRLVTKVRGLLISQMVRKNLRLKREEATKSAAVTLMSTDVDGIARTLPKIHEAWASLVELSVGIYLLSTIVRQASFLVMIPAFISTLLSMELGRRSRPAMQAWNEETQHRVSKTSQILGQLKGIKMISNEEAIVNYVQRMRETEIKVSKKSRILTVWTFIGASLGVTFTPVIVIAGGLFWTGINEFDAKIAFTSLAFISLASQPMMTILTSWSRLGALTACFERIQLYLQKEEVVDSRGVWLQDASSPDEKQPLYGMDNYAIQWNEACISHGPDQFPRIHAHCFLPRSAVNMLVGPTGAGKTILLQSLLGEASVLEGSVHVPPGRVAYCGQETWLPNIPIRSIIIGELPYEVGFFNRIIDICRLRDIDEFPDGDLCLASSRGSNLSGGQKQRIALARALYARAQVLVLDGVLSAVDRPTATAILEALLGEDGLLRQLGVTVVMSTHIMDDLNYADFVLAVDHRGYVTLDRAKKAMEKYIAVDFLDEQDDEAISDGGSQYKPASRHFTADKTDPEQANARQRQRGDWSLYKYYLSSVTTWVLFVWFLMTIAMAVAEKFPNIFIRIWMDIDPDNKTFFAFYALLAVGVLIFLVLWTWTFYLHLVPESSETLHKSLLNSVMGATLSFLTYTDSGAILNRFSQDMSLIGQALPRAFMFFLYTLFGVIADLVITLSASPYATTLFPVIFGLLFIVQFFYLRTSRQMRLLDLEAKTPLYTHFTETSEGLHHIRAFGWEDDVLAKGEELLDNSQKPVYYMYCIQQWLSLVLDLTVAGIAVTLVSVALSVKSTNQAALGLALLYAMRLGTQLKYLMDEWVELETSLGALARLRAFGKETPQENLHGTSGSSEQTQRPELPENWPQSGEIVLSNVTSSYAKANGTHRTALDNVSVDISGGTKVAIVGRTGSGKTSLLLTLLNLLEYTGTVTIDGVEISSIPRSVLRSRIVSISQDLINLPSSVRDNLTPQDMDKASESRLPDASILEALARVGLDRHVRAHGGLDTPLEDVHLSQGQKQLLALARALIQVSRTGSKIVLVDEATSSVDIDCEDKMHAVMDAAFQDCTVLTIAHRLRTMDEANLMLELSHGHVVGEEPQDT